MKSSWAILSTVLLLLGGSGFAVAEEAAVKVLRSQTYVVRDSGPLDADVFIPRGEGPFPAMLVVHGGAWRIGTRAQLTGVAQVLAEHGYTAVAISYRLAPSATFPAQIYDCQAAVRWMRAKAKEFKIDPERIGGFGYSAGGQLVALLGTLDSNELKEPGVPADAPSARLQCVVAGGAPCDFRELPPDSSFLAYWLGGTPATKGDNYRNASPANFISADDPPMFFFSGEDDVIVPISSPTQMVEALKKAGLIAEMYPVKHIGHMLAIFDPGARDHALAFLDHYLKAGRDVKAIGGGNVGGGDAPALLESSTIKTAVTPRESGSSDGQ